MLSPVLQSETGNAAIEYQTDLVICMSLFFSGCSGILDILDLDIFGLIGTTQSFSVHLMP